MLFACGPGAVGARHGRLSFVQSVRMRRLHGLGWHEGCPPLVKCDPVGIVVLVALRGRFAHFDCVHGVNLP